MASRGGTRGSAPRAVEREARRLLPAMAAPGVVARTIPSRKTGSEQLVAVVSPGRKSGSTRADRATMQDLAARDWVEQIAHGTWRITDAGRSWCLRGKARGDGFREQHQVLVDRQVETPEGTIRTVAANAVESPLDWLYGHKDRSGSRHISEEEFDAGNRLRRDFTVASVTNSVTLDWDRLHRPRERQHGQSQARGATMSDAAVAARQRLAGALDAVGPELSGLLVDVCCLLVSLEDVEKARQWPRRSAKIVLRVALGQLARHYGLVAEPETGQRRPRRHHWARDGYRPSIGGDGAGG